MAKVGKQSPKKSRPTFLTSILMVGLVLLMLGLVGMVGLHFRSLGNLIRENVRVALFLPDDMNEVGIMQLQQRLEGEPFTKYIEYTSKEEAKRDFLQMTEGAEDFEDLLGFNPLPASLNLYLTATYTQPDSIAVVKTIMAERYKFSPEQVNINEELVNAIDTNLSVAGLILVGIALLLVLVAAVMIDSTVRLAMYSNRFLIKSMQLVGADRWFITRPYLLRSVANGLLSGILAVLALLGLFTLAQRQLPELIQLQEPVWWVALFLALVTLGILISWWSTWRAVTKYLRTKLDELY